jgi:hypothetical protein
MQRGRGSPDGRIFSTADNENNQMNPIKDLNEGSSRQIIMET